MKRLVVILLSLCSMSLVAQNLDISEYTQNVALKDTAVTMDDSAIFISSDHPSITETYQIPAYSLYHQHWDVHHLRSRKLEIPFANDRLMLLLVQDGNHPFAFPCTYNEIRLPYGQTVKEGFHPGIDLSVESHNLVKSCFDGVVRMSKSYGGYGRMVVIRHYNGLETVYAHLDKICVKPGQIVNAGDVIGQMGGGEDAYSQTLHFETRFMYEHFDPTLMIDFENEALIKNTLSLSSGDIRPIDTLETGANNRPTTEPSKKNTGDATQSHSTGAEYHIVQKGETLYRISQQYNTTIEKILQLNHLENPDKISEGQRLRVK